MKDSNWTLRWNRSSRDAYGHWIEFEDASKKDRYVFYIALVALGMIIGSTI